MDLSISMQSLKNVFRFPFFDPRWQVKLLTGAALNFASLFVPVLPTLPLLGYFARLVRAGARDDDPARLPEWDDWSELFADGLRMAGVLLAGLLPGLLMWAFGMAVYFGSFFGLIAADISRGGGEPGPGFFLAMPVFFATLGLGTLLVIAAGFVLPAALAHVAVERRFSALFEGGAWWGALRRNLWGYLVIFLVFSALYSLIMLALNVLYLSLIFCALIPFVLMPLSVYTGVVYSRLVGQAYGEARPAR